MAQGLNINNFLNVTLTISPLSTGYRNFGATLILGSSDIIDVSERIRAYADLDGIIADFGTTSPEYLAARNFFSQDPTPNVLYVGRWAQQATRGVLRGGVLTPSQQLLGNFNAITTGSLSIAVDGTPRNLTNLNFTSATNLNAVANTIQVALVAAGATGAQVLWDSNSARFSVYSGTTGAASSVGYATTPGSGTDVGGLLGLRSGVASVPVGGIVAESLVSAAAKLADVSSDWYALIVATAQAPANADHLATAAYIEASAQARIYGVTITTTDVLDPTRSDDLGSQLKSLNYKRTFSQYSSSSPYAVASFMGRAATINFEASNSTITMKFKQEPGIVAEYLTQTQANALKAKNVNVFVYYQNGTAIIQEGVMANGYFFDEVQGGDWLVNAVQVDLFNLFYQSRTKIPQTDAGMNQIVNTINRTMVRAVNNGWVAPGQWNADGFGQLVRGQTLTRGFSIYCPPVATQPQANREQRKSPPIQVAAKLAGAVHSADIAITVNR